MNEGERIRKANPRATKKWCIVPLVTVVLLATFLFMTGMSAVLAWTDPPVQVSTQSGYDQYDPQVAVDSNGYSHVVWYGYDSGYNSERIWYSTNTGGTWSEPVFISTQSEYDQFDCRIALDSNDNLHVVWNGYDGENSSQWIWYATNTGGTWSEPYNVSPDDNSPYDPNLAVDLNDDVHVVWHGHIPENEGECSTCYSKKTGASWSEPVVISGDYGNSGDDVTQIATDSSGNAHVVWEGYGETEGYWIYYATNGGGDWSEPDLLSTQSGYNQERPRIAVDADDTAHVAWCGYDQSGEDACIWYVNNTGGEWSYPVAASGDSYAYYAPGMVLDSGGSVHLIWHGHFDTEVSPCDVMYSTNAGGSWSSPEVISDVYEHHNEEEEYPPLLAIDSGDNLHAVWQGCEGEDNLHIYYNTNTGGSWAFPTLLSTQSSYDQYGPDIAVGLSGSPHVTWYGYDSTGGGGEDAVNYGLPAPASGYQIWYAEDVRYAVNATVAGGVGGTVSPDTQILLPGESATITITPDDGYGVASVIDNGVEVTPTPEDTYTIANVQEDHDIVVTFAKGTWYLAEGCTGEGFETWILVENPGDTDATVSLEFDTDLGGVTFLDLQGMNVPAHSRVSYNLGSYLETYDIATRVLSSGQVVCERAVYGPDRGWATCSVGTTMPSYSWYLPEGCTGEGFESWILVQNPNDYDVTVNLALDTEMGQIATSDMQNLPVPAHTRCSWNLAAFYTSYDVATEVTSEGGPVVVERSMYAADRAWAHNSIGSPTASSTWYLAEGCTVDMETWVLVQNPGTNPVEVDVKYLTENGEVQGPQDIIPAFTRRSYNVGETVQSYNVSTKVTSKYGGVIAERSMYAPDRTWGTCSIGAVSPATTWCLAEGCTVDMDTWILVANPGTSAATVSLALDTGEGQQAPAGLQSITIPAGSRVSFHLNDFVTTYEVSTKVTSDLPVVCERAMYGPEKVWADASIGYAP